MINSLYGRLALSLLVLVTLLGCLMLWVSQQTSDLYSQEVTQRLNRSIAMYITDQDQLITNGLVNSEAMDRLANRVMTINPTVEVYLLDQHGKILTHLLPPGTNVRERVDLAPIKQFLDGNVSFPLKGDDPRAAGESRVFSSAPIMDNGQVSGYLYAVLGGEKYQSLRDTVAASFILKMGGIAIVGSIALAFVAALAVFFLLTRRLSMLEKEVNAFRNSSPTKAELISPPASSTGDEVDHLRLAFHHMSSDIQAQFRALQSLDATRRELIANVSHDLRTPLASMQGYIETLLIKRNGLTEEKQHEYLSIAHKHSQRLNALIAELFELAKLDSGAVTLSIEPFSLLELAHDCVQDFALTAEAKSIQLNINTELQTGNDNCFVIADISLIQRVLQNLVDNAIRHTPEGQSVTLSVKDGTDRAFIEVSDTGNGIATHEIPYIFERFYQSQQSQPADKLGAGLGLAIVKKILDLHQSTINVVSRPDLGTQFSFDLPMQTT